MRLVESEIHNEFIIEFYTKFEDNVTQSETKVLNLNRGNRGVMRGQLVCGALGKYQKAVDPLSTNVFPQTKLIND